MFRKNIEELNGSRELPRKPFMDVAKGAAPPERISELHPWLRCFLLTDKLH